jgi:hypothetical protein
MLWNCLGCLWNSLKQTEYNDYFLFGSRWMVVPVMQKLTSVHPVNILSPMQRGRDGRCAASLFGVLMGLWGLGLEPKRAV